jgi:hypothetical protein
MGSMLAFRVVYRGFKPHSGKTVDYEIDICCIACTAVRSKIKDWLPQNQGNVSKCVGLVYITVIIITCSCHDIAEKLFIWC